MNHKRRAGLVRNLLVAIFGFLLGGIWSAVDNGTPWVPFVIPLALAVVAYALAWGLP